jgi:hypothetical protein
VTNEKRLLERAGLREVDHIIASLFTSDDTDILDRAVTCARELFDRAVEERTRDL